MPEAIDVAVVGAGVSGLYAARLLRGAGREPVLLEARDRVGGRLSSVKVDGNAIDLGATWFWANEPRIVALLEELSLATHAQYLAGDALYQDGRGVQRLAGNPLDAPAGRVSGGMQQVAEVLAKELPAGALRLNTPVLSIRAEAKSVELETAEGLFRARAVVLALPPALAVASIDFVPPLSSELVALAAATPVWMGVMTKVVICFPDPFWRARGLAGSMFSHVGPMRELHDMSGPDGVPAMLFGFVQPLPGAPTVSEQDVVAQISALFGPGAPSPTRVLIHDWREEAWTSPADVESRQAYEMFGNPTYGDPIVDGRVHWASTETASAYAGHIEGALVAGERAARSVLAGVLP